MLMSAYNIYIYIYMSGLSPLAWILRWVLIIPYVLPITMLLFWHPNFWESIAGLFIKEESRKMFRPFWVRIPPIGMPFMILGWLLNVVFNALSDLIPIIIVAFIYLQTFGLAYFVMPKDGSLRGLNTAMGFFKWMRHPALSLGIEAI